MILLLHNAYRHPGGEERAVADLQWLISEELGEGVQTLQRDSEALGRGGAAIGLLRGGLSPEAVGAAVRRTGARVVHAHNVHPAFGWRGLAAAREAGARVVLHLHNYRLVCAVGTCFTEGEDCTRCHGRDTLPGLRRNCRGSRAEAAVYAAGLSAWGPRLAAQVDAFAVPSEFALSRLRALGAPVGNRATVVPSVQRSFADASRAADGGYALVVARLTPEKGVGDAVDACVAVGRPLVVAGDGPELGALRARAAGHDVTFVGRVAAARVAELRRGAALAIVPSRYAEILPLAALEAMAAGLPVVAADAGGLGEVTEPAGRYPPGDVGALAARVQARWGDAAAGERALVAARELCAPAAVAARLRVLYDG